jgi:hypothetical protein
VTNLSDPKMRFRYCSKCDGSPCYCEEHIHEHEHLAAEGEDGEANRKIVEKGEERQ